MNLISGSIVIFDTLYIGAVILTKYNILYVMQCPRCKQTDTQVIDSRVCFEAVRRRRLCTKCGFRFTTFEKIERPKLYIIKKDKRRELYSREKLKTGIIKACEKRPISQDKIISVVNNLEQQLFEKNQNEISSSELGELVMKQLRLLDKVAYIRFASVYRSFENLAEFEKEIKDVKN